MKGETAAALTITGPSDQFPSAVVWCSQWNLLFGVVLSLCKRQLLSCHLKLSHRPSLHDLLHCVACGDAPCHSEVHGDITTFAVGPDVSRFLSLPQRQQRGSCGLLPQGSRQRGRSPVNEEEMGFQRLSSGNPISYQSPSMLARIHTTDQICVGVPASASTMKVVDSET